MCNCNQKRTMYSSDNERSQQGSVKMKLIQKNPIVLNGDITGRTYKFEKINDFIWVDKRDVKSMDKITGLQIIY